MLYVCTWKNNSSVGYCDPNARAIICFKYTWAPASCNIIAHWPPDPNLNWTTFVTHLPKESHKLSNIKYIVKFVMEWEAVEKGGRGGSSTREVAQSETDGGWAHVV